MRGCTLPILGFGLALFVVGCLLVVLGFDLEEVDFWLEQRESWLEWTVDWGMRIFCGGVLLLCIYAVLAGLWQKFLAPRDGQLGDAADFAPPEAEEVEEEPIGWGCMVLAVILGYFMWFGMTG